MRFSALIRVCCIAFMDKLSFYLAKSFSMKKQLPTCSQSVMIKPVLSIGKLGDWDSIHATFASVTRDNNSYRMYYSGKGTSGLTQIGLAYSHDGLSWTKYEYNPILKVGKKGCWDSLEVYCPIVWKDAESWKMIFTGCDAYQSQHFQVGMASSDNGIDWIKSMNNPIFNSHNSWTRNSWGQYETEAWGLFFDGKKYNLLYNPVNRRPRQIGIAKSDDLIIWKDYPEPLLPSQGFPWDIGYMKYCAHIFKLKHSLYFLSAVSDMTYMKSRIGLWRINSFQEKSVQFLGYVIDTSFDWCRIEVDTPFILEDTRNNRMLCYYGGRSKQNRWTEGIVLFNLEALSK
jgi:predicted GH43/DUF377 family glycosyl hydrolase